MKKIQTFTIEVPAEYVDVYIPEITRTIEYYKAFVIVRRGYENLKSSIEFIFLCEDVIHNMIMGNLQHDLGYRYNDETGRYHLLEEVFHD